MKNYETLTGRVIDLSTLNADELKAFKDLYRVFNQSPSWDSFANTRQNLLNKTLKRLKPTARTKHDLSKIGHDLEMRLGILQGEVAPPDYRDIIIDHIEEQFGSRYRFCKESGVSQTFLSQVLSGRKEFSLVMLRHILQVLGLGLAILPSEDLKHIPYSCDLAALRRVERMYSDKQLEWKNFFCHLTRCPEGKRLQVIYGKQGLFDGFIDSVIDKLKDVPEAERESVAIEYIKEEVSKIEVMVQSIRQSIAQQQEPTHAQDKESIKPAAPLV